MARLGIWQLLLLGAVLLVVLLWLGPGFRATLERSRQARERDWRGFLLPIVFVVLFVVLLVLLTR